MADEPRAEEPMPNEADGPRSRAPRRSPGDYRPDLRPILILAGLLLAVVVAWLLLSPLILPG
jgi:hypothetical protein